MKIVKNKTILRVT